MCDRSLCEDWPNGIIGNAYTEFPWSEPTCYRHAPLHDKLLLRARRHRYLWVRLLVPHWRSGCALYLHRPNRVWFPPHSRRLSWYRLATSELHEVSRGWPRSLWVRNSSFSSLLLPRAQHSRSQVVRLTLTVGWTLLLRISLLIQFLIT